MGELSSAPAGVTVRPADSVDPAAMVDAFNAAFADYLIRFPPLDAEGWRLFVQRQGTDLALGRVALRGDEVVAFALVTPRPPARSRIAVMGARPGERGRGTAAWLLDDAIESARRRGERSIELEVFAQNPRAERLYRSRGLETVCALYGYTLDADATPAAASGTLTSGMPAEVRRDAAVRWLDETLRDASERWPWQVTGSAVAATPGEVTCWQLAGAQLVVRVPAEGAVSVVSLVDRDPAQAGAVALLAALRARWPGRALQAPQVQREDGPARAFEAAGWRRQPLHQWLLRRPLDGRAGRDLEQSAP